MNNYLPLLQTTTLFAGLSAAELSTLLSRLGASVRSYGKGEALVLAGEPSRRVGIVLSGELEAYRPAPGGVRIPIARVEPGGVFGDVLGGSSLSSPVTVLAAAPCEVLLLPYERLLLSDGSPAHQRVVQNLVRTISDKYFSLSHRIDLLVMKSLRAKVAAYLLSEAARAHSLTFSIPFSRIQLADYLNCDRSAFPGAEHHAEGRAHRYLPQQLQAAGAGRPAADGAIKPSQALRASSPEGGALCKFSEQSAFSGRRASVPLCREKLPLSGELASHSDD